jgi:endonuclease YncB( thermonuclease family)
LPHLQTPKRAASPGGRQSQGRKRKSPGAGIAAAARIDHYPGIDWSRGMSRALLALLLLTILLPPRPAAAANDGTITSYAIVQDDATLKVQGRTIRLYGTYIPATGRGCTTVLRPPRCGSRAARALDLKIHGFIECLPQQRYADGTIGAYCFAREGSILDPPVDLGAWLIEQGFAVAGPDAPFEYGVLEKIARTNRRGVWGFQVDRID